VDNVTHGLAGLLVADAASHWLARRGRAVEPRVRRALSVLGIVAAEFPDSDLVYSGPVLHMGPLGYLLHHRGHTHTIVWAVASAVGLWLVARWWVRRGSVEGGSLHGGSLKGGSTTGMSLVSRTMLAVALIGTLSHLLLDWTNSYGVHPFWPFDGRWFYGDAVFIVEPWLWLVAIPALYFHRPSRTGRVLLPLLFVLILAAVALLGQVARDVAMLLFVFAVVWPLAQWRLGAVARTLTGVAAWTLVTLGFFATSQRAEAAVRASVQRVGVMRGTADTVRLLDVVLNPGPGDWGCWSALVMSTRGDRYDVSTAFVAPLPFRSLATCEAGYRTGRLGTDVLAALPSRTAATFGNTAQVRWRSSWQAPREALATLARTRCEVDAALHFMRAPVWQPAGTDQLLLSDARFGVGGGGFSEALVPARGPCSLTRPWIPDWVPPRADLLD